MDEKQLELAGNSAAAVFEPVLVAMLELGEKLVTAFLPLIGATIERAMKVRRFANLYHLASGNWRQVDPRELSAEDRWKYQKQVWGAVIRWPVRWLRRRR